MFSTRLAAAALAPFFAVAAVVSACGGESNGDTGALSKSQFANKADALCATAQTDRTELLQRLR